MKNKGEIVFTKYGPYTVVDVKLYDEYDNEIKTPRVYSLCRCGESKNMPFCDGTHMKVGFDGTNTRGGEGKTKIYQGEKIKIYDNRRLCSHEGVCELEGVFDVEKTPWIDPNGIGDVNKIIEIIKLCPSGSLTYEIGEKHITAWFDDEKIIFKENGPLYIQGKVDIKDDQNSKEQLVSKEHYTLCRCGKSNNKPFCDGEHIKK